MTENAKYFLSFFIFLFYFYLLNVGLLACEILVSQPGIEPGSLALKVASPKHPEEVP